MGYVPMIHPSKTHPLGSGKGVVTRCGECPRNGDRKLCYFCLTPEHIAPFKSCQIEGKFELFAISDFT